MARVIDPTPTLIRRDNDERVIRRDQVLPTDFIIASDAEVTAMRKELDQLRAERERLVSESIDQKSEIARLLLQLRELSDSPVEVETTPRKNDGKRKAASSSQR